MRGAESTELTGYLIELDLTTGEIIQRVGIPVEQNQTFWNARGGNRGGRGIDTYNGQIYVATASKVIVYDTNFKIINEIDHPHMAGLHEIVVNHQGIWLTSTVHDLVYQLGHNGQIIKSWWGSEDSELQNLFEFQPRELNLKLDFPTDSYFEAYDKYCKEERLHINAVTEYKGNIIVLASRKNAIIKIAPGITEVILQDDRLGCPHNCIITQDGKIVINNTMAQQVHVYNLEGQLLQSIPTCVSGNTADSAQFARPGWQRGLVQVTKDIFLVGTSPATIFEVDIQRGLVGRVFNIDEDVHHCIHGLTVSRNVGEQA